MDENEKKIVIKLWNNGETISTIAKLLPYKEYIATKKIQELKKMNVLDGRSGKTKEKTTEKVLATYKNTTTNPYEIAEILDLSIRTVNGILCEAKLERVRPKHNYKKKEISYRTKLILNDLKSGVNPRKIAKKYDVSTQYVYQTRNRFLGEQNDEE